MPKYLIQALALTAVFISCGDDSSAMPVIQEDAAMPIALLETFKVQVAQALCEERVLRSANKAELDPYFQALFSDRCSRSVNVKFERYGSISLAPTQSILERNTGVWNATRASECLTELAAVPRRFMDGLATCREIIEGNVALGAPCFSSFECEGDAYCAKADNSICTAGTCTARKALAESCSTSDECQAPDGYVVCPQVPTGQTSYCRTWNGGLAQLDQECSNPPTTFTSASQSVEYTECGDSLWCNNGVCKTQTASGGSCTKNEQCEARAMCIQNKCKEVTLQQASGNCTAPGNYCNMLSNLVCSSEGATTGTCIVNPSEGGVGTKCTPHEPTAAFDSVICRAGLHCNPQTSICEAPPTCQ